MTQQRFLTAEWRYLAMFNYPIDPSALKPRIPAACELDSFNGQTYVSVVGFLFLNTRLLGLPIPFHRNFEEVNLRFYVRRKVDGEWRRGVVFIKELVPRFAIAWVARMVYNENYRALPMRHVVRLPAPDGIASGGVEYAWRRGDRWERMAAEISGQPTFSDDHSVETFISEHYWGYAGQPDGGTVEYQVEHPRWRVWQGTNPVYEADVKSLYGPEFVEPLSVRPASVFVADGSEVTVRRGRRLSIGTASLTDSASHPAAGKAAD